MTTQQIEVLARFDGWKKMQGGYRKMKTVFNKALDEEIEVPEDRRDETIWKYFTSPGVLIEMRIMLGKKILVLPEPFKRRQLMEMIMSIGEDILLKDYTAAAIKTSEIIQKLEA
jgi:hypothetical protein